MRVPFLRIALQYHTNGIGGRDAVGLNVAIHSKHLDTVGSGSAQRLSEFSVRFIVWSKRHGLLHLHHKLQNDTAYLEAPLLEHLQKLLIASKV